MTWHTSLMNPATDLSMKAANFLTDDVPTLPSTFPFMLMIRLRLHAAWLLFMLIPT
jgi:hypothetical protein